MAGEELRLPGLEQVERIGAGGFGTVYRAWQAEFGRWVAVKVMADALGGADDHRRFDRERIATGSLSAHPSIVTVHDHGATEEGRPYIVMELFEGGSLADRIASEGPLPPEVVLEVGVGLAGALAAAHAGEVLHRDVKPENVLFSGYGTAALADFGIARLPGATATRSGVITASLSHAPPEVLNGDDPTPATDVYGLASTLWTAVVGRAPFQRGADEPIAALVARIVTAPPPDAEPHGVPAELAAVLARGLAKDPADRPDSAAAFGRELCAVQEALGLAATPLVLGSPLAGSAAAGAAGGVGDEVTRPRQAVPREGSAISGRRRTVVALAAVLVVAGTAGAWALTASRDDVPVVAAPSEGDDGLDASPRSRASATPSAGDQGGSSPSPSPSPDDDALAGGLASPDGGSYTTGSGGSSGGSGGSTTDGGTSSGGGTSTNDPTSTTSPTPTATAPPTSTATDPDPPPKTTTPSPTASPTQPNRAPTAAYVTRVASGTKVVTFDASSSSDPDGDSLTYRWTFNDGTSAKSGKTVTHTFTSTEDNFSDDYTVKLTVTDPDRLTASVSAPSSITMPNIHRMKSWDASQAVRGAGLNAFYSKVYNDTTTGYGEYDVFSQWPAAGTTLSAEANIRMAFWSEPECAEEPEHDSEWCYEDPPPSPTLDRSYL